MSDDARCYTVADVCERLHVSARTVYRYTAAHHPGLEEIRPRVGHPRYRADVLDNYLRGRSTTIAAIAPRLNLKKRPRVVATLRRIG